MKFRFLLILIACIGLAACSAMGYQPAQSGTPGSLNNFMAQTLPAGQTDLVGQTATPVQPGAAGQPAVATSEEQNTSEQAEPTKPAEQPGNDQAEPAKTEEPGGVNNSTPEAAIPATGGQLSLDQLMDYHVVDSTGVPLGDVKDALVSMGGTNMAVGQIPYLVVDSSAREDWYVPVPWQKAQVRPDTQTVVLPLTAAQFAGAPGFNKDVWPSSFTNQIALQSFWANPGQAAAGQAVTLGNTGAMAVDYLRAKDFTDLKVVSPQGAKLGKIKDLAINWQNNAAAAQFSYVILQLDDSISQAEAMVPIPWRLIHPTPGQETLVLNIAPNMLLAAPNFMKGAMPNLYAEPVNGLLNKYWPQQ